MQKRSAPKSKSEKPTTSRVSRKTVETQRMAAVLAELEHLYPQAECELTWHDPLQLLVAVILSAQCTDRRVNQVTPALFARFPDAPALATADIRELERLIRPTGFFRNKARHIQDTCKRLVAEHGGLVPDTMEALLTLPGVARKTANVVLGVAFCKATGVVVDTHIKRLAQRLGMTLHTDPIKIEKDLMQLWPLERWIALGHQLIWHGRRVCDARKPRCDECSLAPLCPHSELIALRGKRPPARTKKPAGGPAASTGESSPVESTP